ncbi:hypothetical protein CDAR_618151 [Caerostris darwini]|uniref:Uncharacterized protein n=1 Tax=Caerostris darwini TaxID=1538125 RepID=A0AAV4U8Z3_9ARAC|nr:hypothetical protein CDAR_618151 [Caerostris darwini]
MVLRVRCSELGRGLIKVPGVAFGGRVGGGRWAPDKSEQFSERPRSHFTANLKPQRQKRFSKKHFFRRLLFSRYMVLRVRCSELDQGLIKVPGVAFRGRVGGGGGRWALDKCEQFSERPRSRFTANLEPQRQKRFSKKHFFRRLLFSRYMVLRVRCSVLGRGLIKVPGVAFGAEWGWSVGPR